MRDLFAFPLGCIKRRLQLANRYASVLQRDSDRGLVSEHLPSGACNRALDLERWQTPTIVGLVRRPPDHFARDVVSVAACALVGAARIERFAALVEQLSRQRTRHRSSVDSMMRGLGAKSFLHLFPDGPVHDSQMLARMPNLPVPDLTEVDRVGEQFIERTAPERFSPGPDSLP